MNDVAAQITSGSRYNGKCHRCKSVVSIFGVCTKVGKAVFVVTAAGEQHRRHAGVELSVPCVKCNANPALVGLNGYNGENALPHTLVCKRVNGVYRPEIPCSAKCVGATGHNCECACGGKNHGAGHG